MDKTLDAILDTRKSPKRSDLGHDASDDLSDRIALFDGCPGINLGALDGERDLFLFLIYAQYLHFDLLANMQHFAGMVDAAPGQLTDMHQSVGPAEVNKSPEVGKVANYTFAHLAGFQFIEQFLAATLTPLLHGQTLGEDEAVACPIDLNDL